MTRQNAVPKVPTPPRGDEIASYATYIEAQKAVDYLSDHKFRVENVMIVGTDLKMVERVTGRLTYGRVALAGLAAGAWFGLFVGLLLMIFSQQSGALFAAIGLGAGFGMLFSVLSYALTGGKRDFTSSSQIVASAYSILCAPERAGEARQMLQQMPDGAAGVRGNAGSAWGTPGQAQVPPGPQAAPQAVPQPGQAQPPAQPAPEPRYGAPLRTPTGEPRYGAMRPVAEPEQTGQQAPPAPPASTTDENRPTPPA